MNEPPGSGIQAGSAGGGPPPLRGRAFDGRKTVYVALAVFGLLLVALGGGRMAYRLRRIADLEQKAKVGQSVPTLNDADRSRLAEGQRTVASYARQARNELDVEEALWREEQLLCGAGVGVGALMALCFGLGARIPPAPRTGPGDAKAKPA